MAAAAAALAGLLLAGCGNNNSGGGSASSSSGSSSSSSSSSGGSSSAATAACTVPITTGADVRIATTTLCRDCAVNNAYNVLSGKASEYADIDLTLSVLTGAAALEVIAPPGVTYPAGQIAGYTLSVPGASLEASVIPQVTISTSLNGTTQDVETFTQLLSANLLSLLTNDTPFFLGVQTTKSFDTVEVSVAPVVASALAVIDVYEACSDATGVGALAPVQGAPTLPVPIPFP